MKFKYNFLEKKLWRIEDDYFYEISEENHTPGFNIAITFITSFKLGENQYLFLTKSEFKITVRYVKTFRNSEPINYEKKIILDQFQVETIFEFTEQDRINSS